MKMTDSNFYIK